jgi:mono/diheme cytochrome c family protein
MVDHKSFWHRMVLAAVPLLACVATLQGVRAEEVGDPAAGRQLAETWCSACHVVTGGQKQGTSTGAPPFAAIAAEKAITPLALRAFLQTPHHRMPDLHLSRNEIDDVTAYIFSLRR